jgi:hypothetical protein
MTTSFALIPSNSPQHRSSNEHQCARHRKNAFASYEQKQLVTELYLFQTQSSYCARKKTYNAFCKNAHFFIQNRVGVWSCFKKRWNESNLFEDKPSYDFFAFVSLKNLSTPVCSFTTIFTSSEDTWYVPSPMDDIWIRAIWFHDKLVNLLRAVPAEHQSSAPHLYQPKIIFSLWNATVNVCYSNIIGWNAQ